MQAFNYATLRHRAHWIKITKAGHIAFFILSLLEKMNEFGVTDYLPSPYVYASLQLCHGTS